MLISWKALLISQFGPQFSKSSFSSLLLRRIISITSDEGDVVFDPLAGTGTTGYVAKALNRNFIMIEKEEKYIEGAKKRFSSPLKFKDKRSRMEEEFK